VNIFLGLLALGLLLLLLIGFRDLGYKSGFNEGYQQGRKDADDWWVGAEQQADQARQTIWREES
jgi:hypothetical protein